MFKVFSAKSPFVDWRLPSSGFCSFVCFELQLVWFAFDLVSPRAQLPRISLLFCLRLAELLLGAMCDVPGLSWTPRLSLPVYFVYMINEFFLLDLPSLKVFVLAYILKFFNMHWQALRPEVLLHLPLAQWTLPFAEE